MAQQATITKADVKTVKGPISKAQADKPAKKERKPLAPLTGEALEQYNAIVKAGEALALKFGEATALTPKYVWNLKSTVTQAVIRSIKHNRPSTEDRKRAKLAAKLASINAEIAALDGKSKAAGER